MSCDTFDYLVLEGLNRGVARRFAERFDAMKESLERRTENETATALLGDSTVPIGKETLKQLHTRLTAAEKVVECAREILHGKEENGYFDLHAALAAYEAHKQKEGKR